jgi:ornithine carbamoyltransferase
MSLLSVQDLSRDEIEEMVGLAQKIKFNKKKGGAFYADALSDRSYAIIFELPSTRTRLSFELAVSELGGYPITLNASDMQLGRGESIEDTARTLGCYVDGIIARVKDHYTLEYLKKYSGIPVINALSHFEHPCQALGDILTIQECKGELEGLKVVYVGDWNNVCNSLMIGCTLAGANFTITCPQKYQRNDFYSRYAVDNKVKITENPEEAVANADVVYTDTWVSMGNEAEVIFRMNYFRRYQVNSELMSKAKPDAIFMHCLPAHRGEEVTDEVIDSKQSVVWRQAENRLHIQKAILLMRCGR